MVFLTFFFSCFLIDTKKEEKDRKGKKKGKQGKGKKRKEKRKMFDVKDPHAAKLYDNITITLGPYLNSKTICHQKKEPDLLIEFLRCIQII